MRLKEADRSGDRERPTTDRGVSPALTHSDFVQKSQLLPVVLMDLAHQLSPWEHFLQMPTLHCYSLVLLHTCISTYCTKGNTTMQHGRMGRLCLLTQLSVR